jgi:hypothetical protein
MPPQINQSPLPGLRGKDYKFIRYGGTIYVVYSMKIPGGKTVLMSWRVNKSDYKGMGIELNRVQTVGKAQFTRIENFGNATEIVGGDPGEHPFQKYVRRLREINGNVSWLNNAQVMQVMLSGYLEGWSDQEMLSAVQQTKWYQSRTEAQRQWEMSMTKAERNASTATWTSRVTDALTELYGPSFDLKELGYTGLENVATKIASGKFGDPTEGFEVWMAQERKKAEKVEGSAAWMDLQKRLEDERAFMNRPEDMFEQIRQDAMEWLGPTAVPDSSVLRKWASRLVSGKASEADWTQYMQGQAKALYPFLGANERWQDRASAYKRIAEESWGAPIGWEDPILSQLGQLGPDGTPTGAAMSYDDYTKAVRSKNQFWQGPVAREEGFDLFNQLNNVFNGVTA